MKKYSPYILLFFVFLFAFSVVKKSGLGFEYPIMQIITQTPKPLYIFFLILTRIGDPISVVIILTLMVLVSYSSHRRACLMIIGVVITTTLLETVLKLMVQRVRPESFMLISQSGYSFPSGHSAVNLAGYWTAAKFLAQNKVRAILYAIGPGIGLSRLFMGVHWPTDVFFGFVLGYAVYLYVVSRFSKEYFEKRC